MLLALASFFLELLNLAALAVGGVMLAVFVSWLQIHDKTRVRCCGCRERSAVTRSTISSSRSGRNSTKRPATKSGVKYPDRTNSRRVQYGTLAAS